MGSYADEGCRICSSHDIEIFFEGSNTAFWFGEENDYMKFNLTPKCLDVALYFCQQCGFIGIPVDEQLRHMVDVFYNSPYSKPGTTHGQKSSYSKRLTDDFFACFNELAGEWFPESVLEVGCQSGYLLHQFKLRGAGRAVGVEPGDIEPYVDDSSRAVDVRRGYLSREIVDDSSFDLVFALQVLEHIEDPREFLDIIYDLLSAEGRLLLAVPNEERSLLGGNPGMLLHQHFNYFTPDSIASVLARCGFEVEKIISEQAKMLYVFAKKTGKRFEKVDKGVVEKTLRLANSYGDRTRKVLDRIQDVVSSSKGIVGLYGANCAMANIFSWIPELTEKQTMILDSDSLKWGKTYSGIPFPIQGPDRLDELSDVVAVPYRLQKEIVRFLEEKAGPDTKVHGLY